jgi:hypothetical protein
MSVKPVAVTTDAAGIARVVYPHYIYERLETGEISVTVNHPDYCEGSFPRDVAFAPPANAAFWERMAYPLLVLAQRVPARPKPIMLQRGAILRVAAYVEAPGNLLTNIHPQVTGIGLPEKDFWQAAGEGWLMTRRIEQGTVAVRIAWFSEQGQSYFSDTVTFQAVTGQTNEFKLQLQPGLRLAGKLAATVPRPVNHGRAQLHVFPTNTASGQNDPLHWESTRAIDADGTFVFESLPPGKVEVVAICDGFVSVNDPASTRKGIHVPQMFILDTQAREIELAMEPTATCEVKVLDDQGQPLAGAEVGFWPNVIWGGYSSTIFARDSVNWEDVLPTGLRPDWNKIMNSTNRLFAAETDDRGIAVISNLPTLNGPQNFAVMHTDYELAIDPNLGDRYASMEAKAGGSNSTTVTLQKKGKQFMEPRK